MLSAGYASAEPPAPQKAPRVYHVPTAWLQPSAGVYGTAGANHRGGTTVSVTTGLGNIAEVDISVSDRFVMCAVCEGDARDTQEAYIASAKFKVGFDQGTLGKYAPAMALGFRRSLYGAKREVAQNLTLQPEFGEMYLAMSYRVSRLELHLGAEMWDALSVEDGPALHDQAIGDQVRPFGGLSYRPARYPRTSMMIDFGWVPEFRADGPELEWVGGVGVRYQALSWGSVELAVRARENGAVDDAVAFLRFNGVFGASYSSPSSAATSPGISMTNK